MSRYEILLFLHLLAAFALVTTVVLLTTFVIATRRMTRADEALPILRVSWLARRLWDIGGAGTLVFGIWLALDLDRYDLLDGWVIAGLVLWVVAAGAGTFVGQSFQRAQDAAEGGGGELAIILRDSRMLALHAVMAVAIIALLIVMIYKPGA